jgi:hypothetical protein
MSDRRVPDADHDAIAHRLVVALDVLPVPPGPSSLRAPAVRSVFDSKRAILFALLMLALVTTVASPQFQQAASELTRYIQRTLFGPGWVGYYFDNNASDASGQPVRQLRFVSSDASGAPMTPDIVGARAHHGLWSPDRERMTISNDSKIYVADRSGRVREVADVGAGREVWRTGWIRGDNIWGLVWSTPTGSGAAEYAAGTPWSFVTVNVNTGALDRRILERFPGQAFPIVSPDGRWLPVAGSAGACGLTTMLYDLVTYETVAVVDANGRPASAAVGFFSDGRMLSVYCDRPAARIELYVGAPGSRPTLVAVVPGDVVAPVVATDSGTDEILVVAGRPDAPQIAHVFDPAGRQLRTIRLPQLTTQGSIDRAGFSRDGQFLAFVMTESRGAPFVQFVSRAGVVDLATGQVTYLCNGGCDYLLLR